MDSFTFTVGKLDAGMAILLGERAHLIEFPSVLLPPGATTGSIVNISVHQNHAEESRRSSEFWSLQDAILEEFGVHTPSPPSLQLRNVTQTSVTLEWPPLQLATSKLRSLDIYKNGSRLAQIPSPTTNTSTKLSGLELNTEYTFQLVLRTTAGTFPSNLIRIRTHTMQDTSGISVCFGSVADAILKENAKTALSEMRAKWSENDTIQIDTTHFVCTDPSPIAGGAPGVQYQRALQLSIPVVHPAWVLACHAEGRMVPIAQYYLGATPQASPASAQRPQSFSQPHSSSSVPSANPARASMPPSARTPSSARTQSSPVANASAFVNQPDVGTPPPPPPPHPSRAEEIVEGDEEEAQLERSSPSPVNAKRKSRTGTMNREFKFPPASPTTDDATSTDSAAAAAAAKRKSPPPPIEVPAPPPLPKDVAMSSSVSELEREDAELEGGVMRDVDLS